MWAPGISRKKDRLGPTWHWATSTGMAACDSAIAVRADEERMPEDAYRCLRCCRYGYGYTAQDLQKTK